MRGIGAAAVVLGALLVAPASAWSADPPPGADMSKNLEYVTRIAGANGITEGKFDKVRGKDTLVITGRFGFKTYDVEDPEKPKLLDEFIPNDLAAGGYWQNEDMELDTKRKLIIGALDPRHTDSPLGAVSGQREHVEPGLQERLLRHLLREPGQPAPDRQLRRPAVRPHVELHPGLQVHLDRRPRAPQRPALARTDPEHERAGAVHVHPPRR